MYQNYRTASNLTCSVFLTDSIMTLVRLPCMHSAANSPGVRRSFGSMRIRVISAVRSLWSLLKDRSLEENIYSYPGIIDEAFTRALIRISTSSSFILLKIPLIRNVKYSN